MDGEWMDKGGYWTVDVGVLLGVVDTVRDQYGGTEYQWWVEDKDTGKTLARGTSEAEREAKKEAAEALKEVEV